MRRAWLFALLLAMPVFGDVRGRILINDEPAPGIEVTLTGRTRSTDAAGRYLFERVPPGVQILKAELVGYGWVQTGIEVKEGDTIAPDTALPANTLVMFDGRACDEKAPASEWDLPQCSDYALDTALIDSAQLGDTSALELLSKRYATATRNERLRIASEALLGRLHDDSAIWRELLAHAEIVVRFDMNNRAELDVWCAAHDLPTEDYAAFAWNAFAAVMTDPRARPLLLRALESRDSSLRSAAVAALASQRDESALPAIAKTLARASDRTTLIEELKPWPAAAALVRKYGGD